MSAVYLHNVHTFVIFKRDIGGLVRGGHPYPVSHIQEHKVFIGTEYEDGTTPVTGLHIDGVKEFLTSESAHALLAGSPAPATGTKDTNPKEAIGQSKIPLHLIPDGPLAHTAMAFFEGGLKYGPYNWRVAGVRASTYVSAVRRHINKWWNGHDTDPHSNVHHLGNAIAGLIILLDAELQDMLNDDRPPKQGLETLYSDLETVMTHLKELHKDKNPPNYTEKEYGNV